VAKTVLCLSKTDNSCSSTRQPIVILVPIITHELKYYFTASHTEFRVDSILLVHTNILSKEILYNKVSYQSQKITSQTCQISCTIRKAEIPQLSYIAPACAASGTPLSTTMLQATSE
jgi:hypothetical protein